MTHEITPKETSADGITAARVLPTLAQNQARPNLRLAIGLLLGLALGIPVGLLAPRLWQSDGVQEGFAQVPSRQNEKAAEVQVYYKAPFASPPLLTFPGDHGGFSWGSLIEVVEQKPDSFKLRALQGGDLKVKWRAEGIPAVGK